MIQRDLLSRSEKTRKIKQFSLCTWRWMGKEVQWNEKYFGTMLLPLLRWPISDPPVQKLRFRPRHFGTAFAVVFSEIRSILKNPFLQNPGAPPKNTKMRMGAAQEINLWPFWRPWFWVSCGNFKIGKMQKPHFPCSSGHFRTPLKMPASHPLEPRRRCHR